MPAGSPSPSEAKASPERTAVIVEDDPDVRDLLDAVLTQAGFATSTAASGLEGVELVRRTDPLVTTLDVGLPDIDGFEVCRRIRAVSDTYVVMLTARADEIDALMGLDAGADDYQTKPFRPRELRARIEAMLRRPRRTVPVPSEPAGQAPSVTPGAPSGAAAAAHEIVVDGLVVDVAGRTVVVEGTEVHLTRSEFDLLAALGGAPGRVLSKDALVRVLWGDEYDTGTRVADPDRRSVEVHMANLRRKLGDDPAAPRWIRTVRGVGYRFDQPS
ncbi:response regulator transcription factor [Isoptericola sp. NPDC057191]|uniref:response regulator transcription factor n=1 Tax=Isoptericola sp. NPDC057191 TaxID=3346041 RepID=UPI003640EB66